MQTEKLSEVKKLQKRDVFIERKTALQLGIEIYAEEGRQFPAGMNKTFEVPTLLESGAIKMCLKSLTLKRQEFRIWDKTTYTGNGGSSVYGTTPKRWRKMM